MTFYVTMWELEIRGSKVNSSYIKLPNTKYLNNVTIMPSLQLTGNKYQMCCKTSYGFTYECVFK